MLRFTIIDSNSQFTSLSPGSIVDVGSKKSKNKNITQVIVDSSISSKVAECEQTSSFNVYIQPFHA
jgi:hypothetical protein